MAVAAVVAATMTMALAAGAQASITIGQLAPMGAPPECDLQFDNLQFLNSSGPGYEVTDDGVLTSWSTNNTSPIPGQEMTFKLYRSTGESGQYKVLAHDGPHPLAPGVNTFKVHIPVVGGEVIGLNSANASKAIPNVCEFNAGNTTDDLDFAYLGNGADGSVIGPQKGVGQAFRVNVSATIFQTPELNLNGRVRLGSVAGGGRVILEGFHLEEVSRVTFGGVPAKSFNVIDDRHVSAVAPRGKSLRGIAAAVTTPAGTATSNPLFFYSGCQVPKLAGKTLAAAKSRLRGAGCKLGRVAKVAGRHGKVVGQSPGAGKVLAPGAKVSVKIGR